MKNLYSLIVVPRRAWSCGITLFSWLSSAIISSCQPIQDTCNRCTLLSHVEFIVPVWHMRCGWVNNSDVTRISKAEDALHLKSERIKFKSVRWSTIVHNTHIPPSYQCRVVQQAIRCTQFQHHTCFSILKSRFCNLPWAIKIPCLSNPWNDVPPTQNATDIHTGRCNSVPNHHPWAFHHQYIWPRWFSSLLNHDLWGYH